MKKFKIAGYKFYKNYEDYEDKEIKDLKEEISDIYKKISEETERDKKVSSEFIDKVFPAEKAGKMKEELYYRMFNSNLRKLLKILELEKLDLSQQTLAIFARDCCVFLIDYIKDLSEIKAGNSINPVLKENLKLNLELLRKITTNKHYKNLIKILNNLFFINDCLYKELEEGIFFQESDINLIDLINNHIKELERDAK